MQIKYHLDVETFNLESSDTPNAAEVIITPELMDKILLYVTTLSIIDANKICAFNEAPQWLEENYDEAEDLDKTIPEELSKNLFTGRVNTIELVVRKESFLWTGYLNNSGATFETDSISVQELLEVKELLNTPKEDLPLWVEKVKSEKGKEVLEWRLQNE